MADKHTPGPWRICNTNRGLYIAGRDPGYFAEIFYGDKTSMTHFPEQQANARLIAEAPAMLEALRALLDAMPAPATRKLTAAWDGARAILSRIDGKQGDVA